ncbi:hypothetical protein WNY78_16980 [Psychroserpens sp. AS72]|uniref:hypothetical protein n=1 Tax=Psychroserpens sp. AS72 TaxID=3135775 RepID=UPI003170C403
MNLVSIKNKLNNASIYHSEVNILNKPSVIGYEKKFKWSWMATQLNTFIIATDFGDTEITKAIIEQHLAEAFNFTKQNFTGWPRGLQSGLGVICILISNNITDEAKDYCIKLKSGKKWAGFTIPVVYNAETNESFQFSKNPLWGRIYYPHFKKLINNFK